MNKQLISILLSVVVGLAGCNREQSPKAVTTELTSDEYAVLSAYASGKLSSQEDKQAASRLKIVILNTTSSGDVDLLPDQNGRPVPWEKTADSLRGKAPVLQQPTIDEFRKVNAGEASLRRSFVLPIDYELVSSIQVDSFFSSKAGGGWDGYYRQFPHSNGILSFSRVGFSPDRGQALLYASRRCGGLCGAGWYVVMEKRDSRWAILKEIEVWVS